MSVYKRANKKSTSWMLDFLYIDPATKQETRYRRAAGKEVRTEAQAKALEKKLKTELTTPLKPKEPDRKASTFADFAKRWREIRQSDWKPAADRGYEQILRVHLIPYFKHHDLREIGGEDVQAYKGAKIRGPKKAGLSPKTVNNHLGVLSSLFEDAVRWHYAERNPVREVRPCRNDRTQDQFNYWTWEEADRFLEAVREHKPQWLPFFTAALRSGLRLGELAALKWAEVDFARDRINVRRSYSHGAETLPKNNKSRAVPMTSQLRTVLAEHRLASGTQERVFLSEEGKLLDPNRVKSHFWYCQKRAGLKRIRIHDLRHSFASQLAIAGVNIYSVQNLLGHQDVKTTMRYAHLSPEAQAGVVQVLDGPPETRESMARAWHAGKTTN